MLDERIMRDFSARDEDEQQAFLTQTWCDNCQQANLGMHGSAPANYAIQNADLVLAFGMRFDDRVTGTLHTYAPRAKKIHIDIDASEFNKNVKVDVLV